MNNVPSPEASAEPNPLALDPLDIQHDTDPADDHGPARRIPHLGHAILFFSLTVFFLILCTESTIALICHVAHISTEAVVKDHPISLLLAQGVAYVLTLLASAWLFPRLWDHSFLHGIQWNILAMHRRWRWLLGLGLLLSCVAQSALHFISTPDHAPVETLFTGARSAWITAGMAVLLGPLMEEIAFRGFLLPALATAYDWLSLERSPAGLRRWENSSMHSRSALVFAAVISSIPFALIHASQISFAWGVVAVLYGVSLVLSLIRIRTHSVACSTLVHSVYNLAIFIAIFIYTSGFHHMERLHT